MNMQRITATCSIRDRVVRKNAETLFANDGAGGERAETLAEFLLSLYEQLGANYPRFYKMDPLSKLGWLATEILVKDSFHKEYYRPDEIGVVLANAHSSLDTDMKYFETVATIPSPSLFVYTLPSIVIGEIGIRHQFKGESAFFVADRFDAVFMETYVRGMMEENILQACIYGWVDLLGEEGEAQLFLIEKKTDKR